MGAGGGKDLPLEGEVWAFTADQVLRGPWTMSRGDGAVLRPGGVRQAGRSPSGTRGISLQGMSLEGLTGLLASHPHLAIN